MAAAASLFVGLAAGAIAALHLRAEAEPPRQPADPIRVATVAAEIQDGYRRTASYTGRLEAARQTALAFERGGLVEAVTADEGDAVRAGQVIARLDTAKLKVQRTQLEARGRELEAQRRLAKLTLDRQSKLKAQGWSAEERLDRAEATLAQLRASIDQVDAQIAAIDVDLEKSIVKAPFDGEVASRAIDEGAVVSAGTPVLTLMETGRRLVRIGLPPDVAARLERDRTYRIAVGGRTLEARLAARRPDLETGTRTVTALFDVRTGGRGAAVGALATIAIESEVRARGAWVPLAALKEGRRGLWTVLVVHDGADGPVARGETVELLHTGDDRAYVRGTFRSGARILAHGTNRVVSGQRVALARER